MSAFVTGPGQTARGLAHERDFAVGAMMFRPSLCEAELDGKVQHLEPRVALVLVALGQAEGRVLSRDDLIEQCWDGVVVGDDAINRVIGKIRRLAESPDAGFLIETVPRVGYRLMRSTGTPSPHPLGARHNEPVARHDLLELLSLRTPGSEHPDITHSEPLLAVLPFDYEGGIDASALAEGTTDCILSMLTRDSGIAVVSRPESLQFRGTRKMDATRTLGATLLVDGAVSVCGDEVRVTAYLIDAACGVMLWSEQFRGTISDPFGLQHLSAMKVTEALRRSHF